MAELGRRLRIELNESSPKRRHALRRYKYTESLSSNLCVSFDQSVGPIALVGAPPTTPAVRTNTFLIYIGSAPASNGHNPIPFNNDEATTDFIICFSTFI